MKHALAILKLSQIIFLASLSISISCASDCSIWEFSDSEENEKISNNHKNFTKYKEKKGYSDSEENERLRLKYEQDKINQEKENLRKQQTEIQKFYLQEQKDNFIKNRINNLIKNNKKKNNNNEKNFEKFNFNFREIKEYISFKEADEKQKK